MNNRLKRNAIKCTHCGIVIESKFRHDFVRHICEQAGKIRRSYNPDLQCYESSYPSIFVDGGLDYGRYGCTDPSDFVDVSEYED